MLYNKRYQLTFKFVDTEQEAKELCDRIQKCQNAYAKKHHKPTYTPWESEDYKEHKFVVWYYRR